MTPPAPDDASNGTDNYTPTPGSSDNGPNKSFYYHVDDDPFVDALEDLA